MGTHPETPLGLAPSAPTSTRTRCHPPPPLPLTTLAHFAFPSSTDSPEKTTLTIPAADRRVLTFPENLTTTPSSALTTTTTCSDIPGIYTRIYGDTCCSLRGDDHERRLVIEPSNSLFLSLALFL